MLKSLISLLLTASTSFAIAGHQRTEPTVRAANSAGYSFSVSADASTTGLGGTFTWRFADHWGASVGVHGFGYGYDGTISGVRYDASLRLLSEQLNLDFHPWAERSFRISAGILFNQNEAKGSGQASGITQTFNLGGTAFTAASVGTLNARLRFPDVGAYIGIGGDFFFFDNAKRWSLGGEVGVIFTGEPDVTLSRTGGIASAQIDAALAQEQREAQNKANDFQFWPVIQLSLKFRF